MLKYISMYTVLISFAIGMFFVYIMGVEPKIVYVYPSPSTVDKYILSDNANNCFKYEKEQVKCPLNEDKISEIPLQE